MQVLNINRRAAAVPALYEYASFFLNCRDFLGSSDFVQLSTLIDILQMQPDVVCGAVEKHRHRLLGRPDAFVLV